MTELSRRSLIAGVAALGAAGLGAAGLAAAPASAMTSPGRRQAGTAWPMFGINQYKWAAVSKAVGGGVKGERGDFPPPDVPAGWFATGAGVTTGIGSFRPPVYDVLDGRLDTAMRAFAQRIPKGSVVTAWHEGEEAGPHGAHVPAATLRRLHAHCYPIFHAAGVKYVQIVGCYSQLTRGKALASYISPVVDAVYLDGYQGGVHQTLEDIFAAPAAAITSACGKDMPRGITETNTHDVPGRAQWFTSVWDYAVANRHQVCFCWWGSGPHLGWLPGDTDTIAALRMMNTGQPGRPGRLQPVGRRA